MEPEDEPTLWDRFAPAVYSVVSLIMTIAFIAAGLAAAYLLWGLFSGQLAGADALAKADRERVIGIVGLAGRVLQIGLLGGTLCLAFVTWGDEMIGYLILIGAAALAFGLPYAHSALSGKMDGTGVPQALAAFVNSALAPGIIGGALVAYDVVRRFATAGKDRPVEKAEMSFGRQAVAEARPIRLSLMAKCWEGPYCREMIRPHCPIFIQKQACWRVKRGCMCEEDILTEAMGKVNSQLLTMAPQASSNFANPATPSPLFAQSAAPRRVELTMAQKRERCRNCIIYNEHEREKYRLLLPIVIVGGIATVAALSPLLRSVIGWGFGAIERVVSTVSMQGGSAGVQIGRPNDTIEWVLVGALGIMLVSKLLQLLEWACFEAKI